jgi:hypothetical protein
MKGLLHRLAARATGTTVTVRSDARLTLEGLAPARITAGEVPGPSLTATRSPVPSASTGAPAQLEAAHDQPRAPSAGAEPPDPHPARVKPAPSVNVSAASREDRASSDAAIDLSSSVPPRLLEYAADEDRANAPRSDPAFEPADRPVRSADRRPPDGERHGRAVRIVREPPLLIPLTAVDRSAVTPPVIGAVTRMPGGVWQHSAREPDVHIHIRCVEVTAVHEPAAPRRRPVSTPPPMSLDAYLAKRARG